MEELRMRTKLIILIVAVAAFYNGIQAQSIGSAVMGIKVGFTSSSLYGSKVHDSLSTGGNASSKSGFNLGISVNSMPGKYFWLKHDVFLVKKGATLTLLDNKNSPYKSNLNTLYLDFYPCSPTFQYKGLQLFSGPYVGMLLNASMQHKDANGNLYKDSKIYGSPTTFKDYTQKIDMGFVAGIEYEFNCGFNLSIRYVQGLVPIIEN